MIGLVIILVIIVLIVLWYIGTMNSIRALQLKVEEADSGIDVALTKRYDVLTKLVAVVKEYKNYEKDTLYETIKLRSGMSMAEKNDAADKMGKAFEQIRVTAEAYPELRSNENFKTLQTAISDVEEHLQAARRLYNSNATAYNTKLVMFPSSVVAGMIGATKKELFEAEEAKRNDVEMNFQ